MCNDCNCMCYDPPDPDESMQLRQLEDIKAAFEELKDDPVACLTAIGIILNGGEKFTKEELTWAKKIAETF